MSSYVLEYELSMSLLKAEACRNCQWWRADQLDGVEIVKFLIPIT